MKITKPVHIVILAILCLAWIAFISYLRDKNHEAETISQTPKTELILNKFQSAFAQLPSDTTAVATKDSSGSIQLMAIGDQKVALFRHNNQLVIFTSNSRYAEILKAERVQPLALHQD